MIALSTGSLYTFGVARVFALAAEAGFDGVEILIDERWDTRQVDYLQQVSDDHHLPICSLHSPFVPLLAGWPRDQIERLKLTAALAQSLGVKTVVVHLPLRVGYVVVHTFKRRWLLPTFPSPYVKMRHWMEREMAAFEASNDLLLCVENMPARWILGRRFNPYWWNNLDEWPCFPRLTLDTTHLGTWGLNPLDVYHRVKERVRHIHLANFNGQEHQQLDDGHLPLAELLSTMRDDGYRGAVVVELGPDALDAQDQTMVLTHLKRQVAFCRRHFA